MYNNRDCADQKLILIGIIFLHISTGVASAAVILDGSLGSSGNLAGPNIIIPDTAGRTAGNNLFHSFSEFSIGSTESATFTGPANIDNILSRVTGGEQSNINGRLASDIPGANLYFLNPAGVMFGPDASLDVTGSFHVTTADYIRMKDGSRFYGVPSSTEDIQLTAALPEAFGFLNNNPAGVSIDRSNLTVPDGAALSVIGGEVIIKGQEKGFPSFDDFPLGAHLNASSGRINLASVASGGEVIVTAEDLDVSDFEALGEIEIRDGALVDVSGDGRGRLLIRGGTLDVDNSLLGAKKLESGYGAVVDIIAHNINIKNGRINVSTSSADQGGQIKIRDATSVTIDGSNRGDEYSWFIENNITSGLFAETFAGVVNSADGASIDVETVELTLSNGALIKTLTSGAGNGGDISIDAVESIRITGQNSEEATTAIVANSFGEGDAGDVILNAGDMYLTNGAVISTQAIGTGSAGTVSVHVRGDIELFGAGKMDNMPGWIRTPSAESESGDVTVIAQNLFMTDGVFIDTSTSSTGNAGNVRIDLSGQLRMTGESAEEDQDLFVTNITASSVGKESNAGTAGLITILADSIELINGARIISRTTGAGSGSEIQLNTRYLLLSGRSMKDTQLVTSIDTTTNGTESDAGGAGNINITASERIEISNSAEIRAESIGAGAGGNLTIRAPVVSILDQGSISSKSETAKGDAGNIELLNLIQLRMDKKSKIETSAEAANGGDISVAARYLVDLDGSSSITTSVGDGTGNGGFINLDPEFVILSDSQIVAKARDGEAGDIIAPNGLLIASPDSLLSVNSERGNDGTIVAKETTDEVNRKLANPRVIFSDVTKVLETPCSDRSGADVIGLNSPRYKSLPESPYALRAQFPVFLKNAAIADNHFKTPLIAGSDPGLIQPKCKY